MGGRTSIVWVNVYETSQRFGGPEEGGWWCETGTPIWTDGCVCRCTDREHQTGFRFDYPLEDKVIPCPVPKMIENANAIADGESPGVTYGWDTAFINRDPEEPEHRGERATGSRKVRIEGHKGRAYPDEWPLYE